MRVVLAQPRGFCAGVVRAIDIVERALEKFGQPVFVRHEIVHNQHVVQSLKQKGARFVEELDEIPDGAVTVFSAHGVAESVVREAQTRTLPVIDATCPLVPDVVLVVGSRNSSNSNRLREIGEEEGIPTYLIADASALDPVWFRGKEIVGLTAGASAPEELVLGVIAALRNIDGELEVSQMEGLEEHVEFRLPPELRN